MIQTYELSDKFIVYAPDGTIAFDSRIMSQRVHLVGTTVIGGRVTVPTPIGGISAMGGVNVPFNKTFTKPPYILSATRKLAVDDDNEEFPPSRIYPPRMLYRDPAVFDPGNYLKGAFTNAQTTSVFVGNVSASMNVPLFGVTLVFRGDKRVWYAVFENEVA